MSTDINRKNYGRKFIVEGITANDQLFSKSFNDFNEAISQCEYWLSIGCEVSVYCYLFSMIPEEV